MSVTYFSHNGELLPSDQAVVNLADIEYSYGFGVYETVRVSKGVIYFLKEHCARLLQSAQIITLDHPFSADFIEASIKALIHKNESQTCNLKILLIGGRSPDQANLYIMSLNPYFPDKKLYHDGAHFVTYNHQRIFPQAKTLNMLPSYLAYKKARESSAYDALLVNNAGYITEGSRTNFFCVKDKTIVSAPEDEILLGVMRTAVLEIATQNDVTITYRNIKLNDLQKYEGAFVTSTSSKIMPVHSIDDYVFNGRVPLVSRLMEKLDHFLKNSNGIMR